MKKVVITGASRGIGKATAEKFLKEGWSVIGTSTSGKSSWAHEYLQVFQLDLSNPKSIQGVVKQISAQGPFDALINNAGTFSELEEQDGDTEKLLVEALRFTLEANLIGTIDFTERMLGSIKNRGHIVTIGSRQGSLTYATGTYAPSYAISKAGLSMYTRKLAARLKERIIVSILDPDWVKTDMGGEEAPGEPEEAAEEIYKLATSSVETGYFWNKGKKRSW